MLTAILMCLAGLVGLVIGGELLVRGAVAIALKLGVSTLFTGLVIVGAATSTPELVASVQAALAGSPGIAWGNIVGSNIANALLILGCAALVKPLLLAGTGTRDAAVAVTLSLVLWGIAAARLGNLWIGLALLAGMVAYTLWGYRVAVASGAEEADDQVPTPGMVVAGGLFVAGLALLMVGANALVASAIDLARLFHVPETVIGLTIVAVGTSLPELAASVAAALRGQAGIALGNVVGSNIYNILFIGGVTMIVDPAALPADLLHVQMALLVASALLVALLVRFAGSIGRMSGAALIALFAANTLFVFA